MDPRPAVSAPALPAVLPSSAPSTRTVSALAPHSEPHPTLTNDPTSSDSVPQSDQPDDHDHTQDAQDELSSLLLGIPDRAATASAPPDLEISSRSLFAFKSGYSGAFTDIRKDDFYESFYNENPERLNLPPPLPNRSAHDQDSPRYLRRDDSDASINDLIFQETKGLRHATSSVDSALYTESDHVAQFRNARRDRRDGDPSSVTPQKGKPPAPRHAGHRPPTQPSSQGKIQDAASSAAFDAHSQPQMQKRQSQHALESRFSISRHASPHPADPQAISRHASPHPSNQQGISRHATPHPEVSSSHIVGSSLPHPVPSSSPPPLQTRQEQVQRHHIDQKRVRDSPAMSTDHVSQHQRVSQPLLHRSSSAPPIHEHQHFHHEHSADHSREDSQPHLSDHFNQHSGPQQRRYTSHALRPQPVSAAPQPALWQTLNQLSLDESDPVANTLSPRRIYPSAAPAYGSSALRTPYESSYVYPQPGSPLETHLSVPASHLFDSPPQQHWARAPAPDLNGLYDPRYDSVVQPPSLDQYPYKGRDDVLAMNAAMSPNVESAIHVPPPSVLSYPGSGLSGRGLYPQQRQSHVSGRGSGNGSGRSNGRSRNHSSLASNHASSAFGYMYGPRAAASVVVPSAPDYLNAQAAAAAAAAAAAVYKSGGVHINGTAGSLSAFGGGGPPGINNRSLGMIGSMRGGGKSGDIRRSGLHEPYGRGKMSGMGSDGRDSFTQSGRGSGYRSLDEDRGFGSGGGSSSNSGNGKFSSFNDIIGRAEELARDQHGCRFLQTKLEEGNTMYVNSIFEECYEKFVDLMTDPFGNYLCQKLFEHCNDSQRLALVERCAPAFPRVSTNMHGTRAVQRMVECLSTPSQVQAVCAALAPAAVQLMKDINGNHVIQRCLHRMDPAHNQFVYDAVANNCFELATHRHGCCVMQRCMDYASPAQRNQLATQINANALPLVQNAFGNYVVQYVLGLNDPTYTSEIIRRLRGHLAELSMQKFSSNVVEKGLQQGDREVRRELIFELISDPDTMRRLLHDAYGNYVIQRALQIAESPQLEQICEAIRPHLNSLRQSPYGKRIQAKIQKRMPKGMAPSIASN